MRYIVAAALLCTMFSITGCDGKFHASASFSGNEFANSLAGDAFKAMDNNNDGQVSKSEFLHNPIGAGMKSLFHKIDTNHDDQISPREFNDFDKS